MSTTQTTGCYSRLNSGKWGIRVVTDKGGITNGTQVSVRTKSGKVRTETVQRVLWSGKSKDGGNAFLCSIVDRMGGGDRRSPSGTYAPYGRRCSYCGERDCEGARGGLCDLD